VQKLKGLTWGFKKMFYAGLSGTIDGHWAVSCGRIGGGFPFEGRFMPEMTLRMRLFRGGVLRKGGKTRNYSGEVSERVVETAQQVMGKLFSGRLRSQKRGQSVNGWAHC